MSGLLELCLQQFDTEDLYAVLGLKKDATESQLRKGYHKVSLKVHPDRCSSKEKAAATEKFQTLGRVYQLLADSDLRAVYDETGEVPDEESSGECKDWAQYWRTLFPAVTLKDIKNFESNYVGSAEERADVEAAYVAHSGDMDGILGTVLLCGAEDEPRFRAMLDPAIAEGRLPEFDKYAFDEKKTNKRKRKEAKEAAEAQDDMASLVAKIQGRASQGENFLDALAAKYGGGDKAKGKGKKKK